MRGVTLRHGCYSRRFFEIWLNTGGHSSNDVITFVDDNARTQCCTNVSVSTLHALNVARCRPLVINSAHEQAQLVNCGGYICANRLVKQCLYTYVALAQGDRFACRCGGGLGHKREHRVVGVISGLPITHQGSHTSFELLSKFILTEQVCKQKWQACGRH